MARFYSMTVGVLQVEADSLVAVLFGTREGLWVDVSQGDVLVPLQVSHQNSDLWLHQTNPAATRENNIHAFSKPAHVHNKVIHKNKKTKSKDME